MIFGLLFLGLQTFLAFFRPKYFVFTYLLYISSFLGFFTKNIVIGGVEIGLFYHSILMLGNYFMFYKQRKDLPKYINGLLTGTLLLFLYGIFYPVATGFSSVTQSIIASKEFSTIFFMHYLFIYHKKFDFKYLSKVLSFLGYYFLLILLVYSVFKIVPPQYIKKLGAFEYYFPTILSLFLYFKMAQANTFSKKVIAFLFLIIWAVGMYYEGHTAITITTILGCLIILFRIPVIRFLKDYKTIILGLTFFGLLFLFLPTDKYIKEFQQNPNIQSRNIVNAQRMEFIMEQPWQGYGFLHRSALEFESQNRYALDLSYIDSGYIDLLGKFGIVGIVIYLIMLSLPLLLKTSNIMGLSLKVFLIQLFLVNITWSVFSFSVGLISLSVGYILLFYIKIEDNNY